MNPSRNASPTPSCDSSWRHRLIYQMDRLGWHTTRNMLALDRLHSRLDTLAISAQTPTSSPSAAPSTTTAAPPTPKKGRFHHIVQYGRPILNFLLEKLAPLVWGLLAPLLLGLWAWGRDGVERLWNWVMGAYLWLAG